MLKEKGKPAYTHHGHMTEMLPKQVKRWWRGSDRSQSAMTVTIQCQAKIIFM